MLSCHLSVFCCMSWRTTWAGNHWSTSPLSLQLKWDDWTRLFDLNCAADQTSYETFQCICDCHVTAWEWTKLKKTLSVRRHFTLLLPQFSIRKGQTGHEKTKCGRSVRVLCWRKPFYFDNVRPISGNAEEAGRSCGDKRRHWCHVYEPSLPSYSFYQNNRILSDVKWSEKHGENSLRLSRFIYLWGGIIYMLLFCLHIGVFYGDVIA